VVAKNNTVHTHLAAQIKDHSTTRSYLGIISGHLKTMEGTINAPIGRSKKDRKKMAIDPDGRAAITHYTVLEEYPGYSLVRCLLETGRTHQIRVHMASLNHPVACDPVYGTKSPGITANGQLLHAEKLGFIHPTTGQYVEFTAPPPKEFTDIVEKLRKQ